jgi:hypothetical protein
MSSFVMAWMMMRRFPFSLPRTRLGTMSSDGRNHE